MKGQRYGIFVAAPMTYSIIVAVFNRPDELDELLQSLSVQTFRDFEVIVVEDGSSVPASDVVQRWRTSLNVSYYAKENTGPGLSRNYGCRRASGDVFIFLDSDCTVPPTWLENIDVARRARVLDAFGGPDREHPSFSPVQKAISFAMTSFLTTGGIRGGKIRVGGAFHPRSFNMGLSREVFNRTDGFSKMRFGEDIDLSIRIIREGFTTGLIPEAWVWHKRRSTLRSFFKQVHNSGIARVNLTLRHPGTLKATHFFPAAFTTYVAVSFIYAVTLDHGWAALLPLAFYTLALFVSAVISSRSATVAGLSVVAAFVQLIGYGTGFIRGLVRRIILGKPEGHAFEKTFYA